MIACSTGGPKALGELIPQLPRRSAPASLIVQHMPPGFTASLATRLDGVAALDVREAAGGESLDPGVACSPPAARHLRLDDDRRVRLSDDAADRRPAPARRPHDRRRRRALRRPRCCSSC